MLLNFLARTKEIKLNTRCYVMELFNVKFVGEVEKFPQLYDSTLVEYSKRDAVEKAWKQVAKATSMPVYECKEKWRNLRSTFAKNLKPKPNGTSRKKRYYLMDAMQFAMPFIKVAGNTSGNLNDSIETSLSSALEVDVGLEEGTVSSDDLASPEIASPSPTQQEQATRGPHGDLIRKRKQASARAVDQAFSEYLALKRAKLSPKDCSTRNEGVRHFLMSLMPDLIQMNDVQLRTFKINAMKLIRDVLESPTENFVTPQSCPSSAEYSHEHSSDTVLAPVSPQQPSEDAQSTEEY